MKTAAAAVATVTVAIAAVLSLAPHAAQAQSVDVARSIAVLETKVDALEVAIDRNRAAIDRNREAIARNGEAIAKLDKKFAVLEEKIDSVNMLLFAIVIPLMLLILASLFGLLTKGILWDKDSFPRPQSTRRGGEGPLQPAATRV